MMKKFLFLFHIIILCISVSAQEQQGFVKTRGRIINGQLVHGTPLSGATITLNFGNSLVSGSQGEFSFKVPSGKTYSLVMAQKKGYTLTDPDYTRRSFNYSASNPFYVVLEDENQRQADINAATRKVRRTLMAQLQAREDEIEALKEQNKLSEDEYQKRLQELYDNQSKCEQLVKEMAERYASTDYDQLDEFNRQVQMFIEEGELQKADSLIRSKGDMEKRVEEYHNVVAANQKTRHQLEQSEAGAAKTYEDLSQDLLRRSEIFRQAFLQDSALYCLKMRADLDTTNIQAVWEYTDLCYKQNKFEEWEKYGEICLRVSDLNNDLHNVIACSSNLGLLYLKLHNYDYSKKYYDLALENIDKLFQQNPDAYRTDLAMTQNNLGMLNYNLHDYVNCERYYNLALENRVILSRQNPNAHKADLAAVQGNLGLLYKDLHDYANSEKFYKAALENYEQLFIQNPDAYRSDLAKIQSNLGSLYLNLQYYSKCELYYKSALEQLEPLFQQNPAAYRSDLASVQTNLGILYRCIQDYYHSEKYYMLALENREYLFRQNPNAYRFDLAEVQNSIGIMYKELYDYEYSEKYYMLALENRALLYDQAPDTYRSDLASTYWNIMILYLDFNELEKYDKYLDSALDLYTILYEKNPSSYTNEIVQLLNRKAKRLMAKGKLIDALIMEKKALDIKNED